MEKPPSSFPRGNLPHHRTVPLCQEWELNSPSRSLLGHFPEKSRGGAGGRLSLPAYLFLSLLQPYWNLASHLISVTLSHSHTHRAHMLLPKSSCLQCCHCQTEVPWACLLVCDLFNTARPCSRSTLPPCSSRKGRAGILWMNEGRNFQS